MSFIFTKINSIALTLRTGILLMTFMFVGCSQKQVSTKIEERDGLLYLIGDEEVYTGNVTDTIAGKIIQYDVLNGKKNGEFKIKLIDGTILMHGRIKENLNEGIWKYYYPNGQLESMGNFVNNVSQGKWTWYFENGRIKEIGYFKDGKKDGSWMIFDEKGNLKRKLYFKEDRVVFDQEFDKELFS